MIDITIPYSMDSHAQPHCVPAVGRGYHLMPTGVAPAHFRDAPSEAQFRTKQWQSHLRSRSCSGSQLVSHETSLPSMILPEELAKVEQS